MGTGVSLGNFLNHQLRRPAEAESAFRNGITLDPDSSPLWNNLGDLLSEKPLQFAEAKSAYRQAIRIEPDNAWPWCNLGNLLSGRLNRFPQAQAAYRRAISSDSKWAQPWNGLGTLIARRQLDRNDEAASAFLMSINLDTTQKAAWSNLTYLWSQEPGLVRNQTTENIHKLLSLAATPPEPPAALTQIVEILWQAGKTQECYAAAQQTGLLEKLRLRSRPLVEALQMAVENKPLHLATLAAEVREASYLVLKRYAPEFAQRVAQELPSVVASFTMPERIEQE